MSDITRIFNVETRALTNVQRKYAGVVCDAVSTTLHFEYNPANFLSHNEEDDSSEYYIPYIMFNVHDNDGNPLVYGPESTPKFDGWTFSIPWDVTSRVKSQRVEYQLFFVKNTVKYDPTTGVANLGDTEYILSAMDGIALKKAIQCSPKKNPCCPPTAPTTEPNVVGYINLWKQYGIVVPVEQVYDEDADRMRLVFHTYDADKDMYVDLNVPILEDGLIPHRFLDMVESIDFSYAESEEYKIPSAKAVIDWLVSEYTHKTMSIAQWEADRTYSKGSAVVHFENLFISLADNNIGHEPTLDAMQGSEYWTLVMEYDAISTEWPEDNKDLSDTRVPSEKLTKLSLDDKMDDSQVIRSWDELKPDYDPEKDRVQVPSGKLTKDSLDAKLDDSQLVTEWSEVLSDSNIPSEKLTKESLDSKLDDVQLVTEWSDPVSDENVPSEKLTKDTLDTKVNQSQITQEITGYGDTIPSNYAVKNALDLKLDDSQLVTTWDGLSDENIPSQKLTKDSLDEKTDYRMAIRHWYPEVMYGNDSTVMYDGTIWISRADENKGHVPNDTTESRVWWSKVEGSGSGSDEDYTRFVDIIGDGESTVYLINHGLGCADVFYSMRFNDSYRQYTDADVYVVDDNILRVETYAPIPVDSVVITVGKAVQRRFSEVIGDGESTEFELVHNFGTYDYFISVLNLTNSLYVRATVVATTPTKAVISFTTPPAKDSIRVVLSPNLRDYIDGEAVVIHVDTPSKVWEGVHDLGRMVQIQAFDENGIELTGNIIQDFPSLNKATIRYNNALTGYMVIR